MSVRDNRCQSVRVCPVDIDIQIPELDEEYHKIFYWPKTRIKI